ncbi:hypothetical protein SDJN02_12641, partial [Cucurbita argyrosperma subsp. argyrosperma]
METQQSGRLRFSFRNATVAVCLLNLVAAFLMLQGFLFAASSRNRSSSTNPNLALEEWRKRKMERARVREMEKNGTLRSPTSKSV